MRENHAGPAALALRLGERIENRREIVAADVGDERGQRVVGHVGQRTVERGIVRAVGRRHERLAHGARRQAQQALIFAARHHLESLLQPIAAGPSECGLEPSAPAQFTHAPTVGAEEVAELTRAAVGHDAIQALAVHVDDPQNVTETGERLLGERFPHVALVQLRVANHHDEALGRARSTVVDQIARGQRAERRHDRAQTHRPRRQIDDLGILSAARIRLQTAELSQRRQPRTIESAAQELDRVERRRRVRFRGDDVARPQRLEVERGEETDDGGGRGLVTPHFDSVGAGPRVRVVHHPRGQPQHAALDGLEDLELGHPASSMGPKYMRRSTGLDVVPAGPYKRCATA